jgi:hypothetical protein
MNFFRIPTGPHQQPLRKVPLIESLARNNMPHPSSWVCHITIPPWNQFNVAVHYRLTCISAIIDSNIELRYCRVCMHDPLLCLLQLIHLATHLQEQAVHVLLCTPFRRSRDCQRKLTCFSICPSRRLSRRQHMSAGGDVVYRHMSSL